MELKLIELTKKYGDKTALDCFSYAFHEGIYGILGANGAGKSTMMNLITDNLRRDGGSITLDGREILEMGRAYRHLLGYMTQRQGLYESMTAESFLVYMARLKEIPSGKIKVELDRVLERTHLTDVRHEKIVGFSGGMKQRVLLAQALLGDPKILILDEPTAGLDPQERARLREHIRLLAHDRIVLLATHIVSDIEATSDYILLLQEGSLLRSGTAKALISSLPEHWVPILHAPVWRMCTSTIWERLTMSEWRRIFSRRKRRAAMIFIPLLCLTLFFYQKSGRNPEALLSQSGEYRSYVEAYRDIPPEQIVQSLSSGLDMTEERSRILDQAKHLAEYPAYLVRIQKQAEALQATGLFGSDPDTFVYRNITKTARDFAALSDQGLSMGNDRAVVDWLDSHLADWSMLLMVLLFVMSFPEELETGIWPIIRACPGGRSTLQKKRLRALFNYCVVQTFLLYTLPLILSLLLDGGWEDLSRPVQSLFKFRTCTIRLSVIETIIVLHLIRILSAFLLGMLFWVLLSFLEHIQLSWLLTALGLGAEYLLYTLLPVHSLLSPLQSINVFSFVFPVRLFTQYENLNIFTFPVGRRSFLLVLGALLLLGLGVVVIHVLPRRYPFGNRNFLGRWVHLWNQLGDKLRLRLGLYGMELYKFLFLSAGGLILLLGLVFTRDISCNTGAYDRAEDRVYRQYLAKIEGPVTKDTYLYLEQARNKLGKSNVDTTEFEMALDRLDTRLSQLGKEDYLIDEIPFLNIYGEQSRRMQRHNSFLALTFLALSQAPLFSYEQDGDIRRLLRACPGGRSVLFRRKYAVSLTLTATVWFWIFFREWQEAISVIGEQILPAPAGSLDMLAKWPTTISGALVLLYLWKAMGLLLVSHLSLFLAELGGHFERTILLLIPFILAPAAAYTLGGDSVRFLTPMYLFSDASTFFSGSISIPVWGVWMLVSILALWAAGHRWCRGME